MSKFMDDYFDQGYNDEGPMPVDVMISIMQDMKNRQEGNALPDTIGAEYYFLQDFITLDMDCDFTYIEKDFLKHCSDKLPEFLKYTRNIDLDARYNENVSVALQKKILYFIYGGAQSGDAYCRELLKYLFKIYIKIIYVFLTIFLYLLKCPQSLILSALRAFCFCGKAHIPRSIFLYFRYQSWLKSW